MREVAAFLLDHDHFAGVPPTALVSCHAGSEDASEGSKVGSLQVQTPTLQSADAGCSGSQMNSKLCREGCKKGACGSAGLSIEKA